ncbi:MAG: 30S ribosomal protein S12 methylthiotransferase RimO [Firmicutes bacterium]|nr:30S ribosomal protein S12 methylthiotransferase RimO [Bacillota bacterium]
MENINVYLLGLGCAKNMVDSELMSGVLRRNGYRIVSNEWDADVIIINTCGFIEDAKKESISSILRLAQCKEEGRCQLLIATGCMPEKWQNEMAEAMPEIDAMLGSREYTRIAELIAEHLEAPADAKAPQNRYLWRDLSTPPYSAYLKISEGCNNRCTYCLIPQLRGDLVSRPQEDIIAEAEQLLAGGVLELNVIAQDVTAYGMDIYGHSALPELLEKLAQMDFKWIRLLYAYPTRVDEKLLTVMAAHKNICAYIDIPIQYGEDTILKAMNRHGNTAEIEAAVANIRRYLPDAVLRTTIMTGFPGETDETFAKTQDFLERMRFDWLGVFCYSLEEDTPAFDMADQVPAEVAEQRRDALMEQAADVTETSQQRFVGTVMEVLAEEAQEQDGEVLYVGRNRYQAPEVDGVVYFTAERNLLPGEMVQVKITACDTYDLYGQLAE